MMADTDDAPARQLSEGSISSLTSYARALLDYDKQNNQFRNKMQYIDYAYARYTEAAARKDQDGVDKWGKEGCGVLEGSVVNPVVISNCAAMVAYWGEVFLSGYPIFPVVTDPEGRENAEALEGIIQDHITLSAGDAELQLSFNEVARYNLGCMELDWAPIPTYNPSQDLTDFSLDSKIKIDYKHINKMIRWDMYNTFWDRTCSPSSVGSEGEFIGTTKVVNRVTLKALLNYLSNEKKLISSKAVNEALASAYDASIFHNPPHLSKYLEHRDKITNWDAFLGFTEALANASERRIPVNTSNAYTLTKIYARVLPSDHRLPGPNRNHPQIWKLLLVNGQVLIHADKITSAYDKFPAVLYQAVEDGLELQSQSYAEMTMPIQEATTKLFNARFQMANRMVGDRALYNPDLVRASDLELVDQNPSAKIPVRPNALLENPFDSAYKSIPFNPSGTETLLQDAMLISSWQDQLTGINSAGRGQFVRGNKTLGEFSTVMGNSDNRSRLTALVIDRRALTPMKEMMKLNIFMFGEDTTVIAPRTNKLMEVAIQDLIASNLQFEMADGYTPKSKMANTEMLMGIINMISTSPALQQVYGTQLPAMVAHLATLGGLRGFDQYATTAIKEWEKSQQVQIQLVQLLQQVQQQLGGQGNAPEGE